MILYPKAYFNNVEEIGIEFLVKKQIKALILDVDNTLIDYDRNLKDETIKWAKQLKWNKTIYIIKFKQKRQNRNCSKKTRN